MVVWCPYKGRIYTAVAVKLAKVSELSIYLSIYLNPLSIIIWMWCAHGVLVRKIKSII